MKFVRVYDPEYGDSIVNLEYVIEVSNLSNEERPDWVHVVFGNEVRCFKLGWGSDCSWPKKFPLGNNPTPIDGVCNNEFGDLVFEI